ncbi:MAG: hypothetical protein ABIG30_00910 [Candidatus Aenigmatarchaeota archaeon]
MKHITILITLLFVLVAGCTTTPGDQTDNQTTTVADITTTVINETTTTVNVTNTTTTINDTSTTIRLGDDCNETDSGKDYYVKGTVTYPRAPQGLTRAIDKCSTTSNVTLYEYYCAKVSGKTYYQIYEERYTCPVLCKDGVCVNSTA